MAIVESKYRGTQEYKKAYEKLQEVARERATISYTEVAEIMGINPHNPHIGGIIGRIIGAMSEDEHDQGKPMISAVVVNKTGQNVGKPGSGFLEMAEELGRLKGLTDLEKQDFWEKELKAVYATYSQDGSQQSMEFQPPEADWFLESLVEMANRHNIRNGVTLQVGGFLISGIIVSGRRYFEGFASEYASVFTDQETADLVRQTFSKGGEIYTTADEDPQEPIYPPAFIHLEQARFFNTSGKPIPANRGVFWRGRISEVSGFILGRLSAEEG